MPATGRKAKLKSPLVVVCSGGQIVRTANRRWALPIVMWFKVTYSLIDMYLWRPQEAPISVPYPPGEGETTLWMRSFSNTNINPELCCSAVLERNVRPEVVADVSVFVERSAPARRPPVVKLPYRLSFSAVIDEAGRIPEKYSVPLDIMPRSFQASAMRCCDDLPKLQYH